MVAAKAAVGCGTQDLILQSEICQRKKPASGAGAGFAKYSKTKKIDEDKKQPI